MDGDGSSYVDYYGRSRRTASRSVEADLSGLSLNPELVNLPPVPVLLPTPEPFYPSVESNDDSTYPLAPANDSEPEYNSEPEYHPAPNCSGEMIDYPEPLAGMPYQPERPFESDHSSFDDNREHLLLLGYQDDSEDDYFYEPNILRHTLNANKELIGALRTEYGMAELYSKTFKEKYFRFLGQVKITYKQRKLNKLSYPLNDWVLSTLYLFPRDRFWMEKTNELLDGERVTDFHSFLTHLQCLVSDNMTL